MWINNNRQNSTIYTNYKVINKVINIVHRGCWLIIHIIININKIVHKTIFYD